MSSRHLVDASLVAMLEFIPPFAVDRDGVAASRALFDEMELAPPPANVRRSELTIPVAGSAGVRALFYEPLAEPATGVILHIHAGGMIMGKPEMSDPRNALLAGKHGCAVLSVDYRLAPEHVYPAALDDADAAYHWLLGHEATARTGGVILLGESAGGGLVAALSRRLAERGQPPAKYQALVYPMLDPRSGQDGHAPAHLGDYCWTRANNRYAWAAYLGDTPADAVLPPAGANPAALPPTYIAVGALDLFLPEDVAYAMALSDAGVPIELHIIPGGFHGFDMLGPSGPEAMLSSTLDTALAAAIAARP